jgi:hypothetical protein
MHDCFGKPLKPFDKVRAATKEELEAQGHPEKDWGGATLSPPEQLAIPASTQSETCNVHVVPMVEAQVSQPTPGGMVEIKFLAPSWPTLCTARTLVKIEG